MITYLRTSMWAVTMVFALSTHAADGQTVTSERPTSSPKEKVQRAPSKEATKPTAQKKAPRKAAGSEQQKPAAKPCEEVKPCAIE